MISIILHNYKVKCIFSCFGDIYLISNETKPPLLSQRGFDWLVIGIFIVAIVAVIVFIRVVSVIRFVI